MRASLALLSFALLLSACGNPATSAQGNAQVALSFSNLVPIDKALGHYAAWAVVNGNYQKLGDFLVDAQDQPTTLDGAPLGKLAVAAPAGSVSQLFVTQELPSGAETTPSKQIFLKGDVANGQGTLAAPVKLTDYQSASGSYFLDDPVLNYLNNAQTYDNGIWFGKLESKRYQPSLTLPDAPSGWMYAGWTIMDGHALRMGKFVNGETNDDFDGYSGRNGASALVTMGMPPMPGEDFVTNLPAGIPTGDNQPQLAGAKIIISLENATLVNEEQYPSPIHLFEATVPQGASMDQSYTLTNMAAADIPAGSVTIQ